MAWTNLSFAYGAILTSSQMTQLYNNMTTISPLFGSALFGTVINFTKITATNATWAPNANTKRIVACCVGGGGGGRSGSVGVQCGEGGQAGEVQWGHTSSVSGTYAATIGAGGASDTAGGTTSFGAVVSAQGGLSGLALAATLGVGLSGESCVGRGGVGGSSGGSAAANSGAGGGGSATNSPSGGVGGSGVIYVWEFA